MGGVTQGRRGDWVEEWALAGLKGASGHQIWEKSGAEQREGQGHDECAPSRRGTCSHPGKQGEMRRVQHHPAEGALSSVQRCAAAALPPGWLSPQGCSLVQSSLPHKRRCASRQAGSLSSGCSARASGAALLLRGGLAKAGRHGGQGARTRGLREERAHLLKHAQHLRGGWVVCYCVFVW